MADLRGRIERWRVEVEARWEVSTGSTEPRVRCAPQRLIAHALQMQPRSKIATRSGSMRHLDPMEVSTAPVRLSIVAAAFEADRLAPISVAARLAAGSTVRLVVVASMAAPVAAAPVAVAFMVAVVEVRS